MDETTLYRHPELGISAPAAHWRALGFAIHGDQEEVGYCTTHNATELLILGMHATGSDDWRAIAWALAERVRRGEEQARRTGVGAEAKAIEDLARAIAANTEEGFLDRLLPRLTERLQHAIRQQLGKETGR